MDMTRFCTYFFLLTMGIMVNLKGFKAQTPQPPSFYGGNPALTWDIRQPEKGSWYPRKVFDYGKFAQQRTRIVESRNCATVEVEAEREALHPNEDDQDFETWMSQQISGTNPGRRQNTRGQEVYTLPTVIHVIYSTPEENISEEQVLSQIRVLNEDYRRTNPDRDQTPSAFRDRAVDTGIEFCLATVDPNGNPTNGINRVSMAGAPFSETFVNEVIKPRTIWDPNRYLNIWVANLDSNVLGFAQFPESGTIMGLPLGSDDAQTDGVVITYTAFGTVGTVRAPFNRGRTATHEMGHWFGLRHIWGDGGCADDDFCADTPPASSPTMFCPGSRPSCVDNFGMVQNFMDYTNDACMNLFTYDQRQRMRTVIQRSPRRSSLLTSTACQSLVEPPQPMFTSNVTMGCDPLKVSFTDQSAGEQLSYSWNFPGGRPSTSNKPQVEVNYKKPGIYPVTLRVTNPGGTRTLTREQYIEVFANGTLLPVAATFETDAFPPEGFSTFDPDPNHHWIQTPLVSAKGKGTGCITINNYDNNQIGSFDALLSPIMDISSAAQLLLSFDVAYAPYNERYQDSLIVMVATDCGTRFEAIYYRGGTSLSTASPTTNPFTPSPSEWNTAFIDLSQYLGNERIQLAFINRNGFGNNLYLDNIRLNNKVVLPPRSLFIADQQTICAGQSVAFTDKSTGNPTRWVWSFPGGFPASDTTPNPKVIYTESGEYAVSLTVYNEAGEDIITQEAMIQVQATPAISLSATQTDICAGEEITLLAEGKGPFVWSHDPALPLSAKKVTVIPATDQVYRVATTNRECEAEASLAIKVRPTTQLLVSPPEAKICAGESVTLTASGAATYNWSPAPSSGLPNSETIRISPDETTTYIVEGVNDAGCSLRQTVVVRVTGGPQNFFAEASQDRICAGESVSLKGRGAVAYQWSPGTSLNQTNGKTVIAAPERTTTYTVTGFDDQGCRATQNLVIEVDPGPQLDVTANPVMICPGEEVTLRASGGRDLRWWGDDMLTQDRGVQVVAYPLQTTVYYLSGRSKFGCEDTTTIEVRVRDTHPVNILASRQAVCFGERVYLRGEGALAYQWLVDGQPAQPNSVVDQIALTVNQPTTVTLIGTDVAGCEQRDDIELTLADDRRVPAAVFSAEKLTACKGSSIQFTAEDDDAVKYLWEFPGGTPGVSQERNPVITFNEAGFQDVTLTVTGCDGRQDQQTKSGYLTITEPFDLTLNTTNVSICAGNSFTFEAAGAQTYQWSPRAGLDQAKGPKVIARPLQTTTYTLTATDGFGCSATQKVIVEVNTSSQQMAVTNLAPVICEGDEVNLIAEGGVEYEWSPAVGLDRSNGSSVVAAPAQTTLYTVKSVDAAGCIYRDTVTVTVRPRGTLVLDPGPEVSICAGEQVPLAVTGEGIYQWIPAYGLNTTRGNQVLAYPDKTTTYTITGVDAQGCSGEAEITVTVAEPTPFTVNVANATICQGDTTLLTVNGGENIQWSPFEGLDHTSGRLVSAFPQESTTYTLTSGTAECQQTQQIAITVLPAAPLAITPQHPTICPGASINLSVDGRGSFLWEQAPGLTRIVGPTVAVTPLQTQSYTVRGIGENGCISEGRVTVQVRKADFLSAVASEATFCDQATGVQLTLDGADSLREITWLPADGLPQNTRGASVSVRPQFPTVYRVAATDQHGCRDTAYIPVHVQRPRINFTASTEALDLAQSDGKVEFKDLTFNAVSWEWDFGGGSRSTEQNPVHYFNAPGNYLVRLTVSNGVCKGTDSLRLQIKNSSNVREIVQRTPISVDRRPDGVFLVSLDSPREMQLEIRLLHQTGRVMLSGVLPLVPGLNLRPIDLRDFPKGTYYLEILDADREERLVLVND